MSAMSRIPRKRQYRLSIDATWGPITASESKRTQSVISSPKILVSDNRCIRLKLRHDYPQAAYIYKSLRGISSCSTIDGSTGG